MEKEFGLTKLLQKQNGAIFWGQCSICNKKIKMYLPYQDFEA